MLISCNKLKEHIEKSDNIDWVKVWDIFTIRTAEVEGVSIKGNDLKDVIVVKITKIKKHPDIEKYNLCEVSDGSKTYHILTAAPNVREGMICPLVKIGGMVSGVTITAKKIAGYDSEGMLCSGDELGISADHSGILELPDDFEIGKDIKEVLPIDDVIVEIDNKSLTNRPDLWGHYGIAREICAITNHKLKPLELLEIKNDQKDLDIMIKDGHKCLRYCGITLDNVHHTNTPFDIQIFLYYVGMRSLSLLIDLTNYIMLELGQPMHAFDSRVVKNILVDMAYDKEEFVTLDRGTRVLSKDVLLIKNNNQNFGIAGIMGGLNSEILPDTTSIMLESACFDAPTIRRGATFLGMRTEASARYEKSLDPELCPLAIKRYAYLLKKSNPEMHNITNLTDIYPGKKEPITIDLEKEKLYLYMGDVISDKEVIDILESLEFKVENLKTKFKVLVPSFRSTKDITLDVDLIEEIARIHGYENIEVKPLKLDLTFKIHESIYEEEYKVKSFLTNRYSASEVHSYLWYDTAFLKECDVNIQNVMVLNKPDNSILRDNLAFSLLPLVRKNYKNYNSFILYEIGTIIKNNENKRSLSILLADSESNMEALYHQGKEIALELFKAMKNIKISFEDNKKTKEYYVNEYAKNIMIDNDVVGTLDIVNPKISFNLGKKKAIVCLEIDFDKYLLLTKKDIITKEQSKYPSVYLDYTITTSNEEKYENIEVILNKYIDEYLISYYLNDYYQDKNNNKYTVRFEVGSFEKTLDTNDLNNIKLDILKYLKDNNLVIEE